MAFVKPNYKCKRDFIVGVKLGVAGRTYDNDVETGLDWVYAHDFSWNAQVELRDGIVIHVVSGKGVSK